MLSISNVSDTNLENLFKQVLYRKHQTDILLRLFGPPSSLPCQSIFIYGPSSSGKTLLVSQLLRELQVPYTWVNCHEAYTTRLLFASLTDQLIECSNPVLNAIPQRFCDNMSDFVRFLESSLKNSLTATYMVFDDADMLRDRDPSILATLLRLQEITKLNICSIFISEITWEKFRSRIGFCDPVIIHFPEYNKNELLDILCLDCPSDYTPDSYAAYISMILNVFYVVTRNLHELRYLAHLKFPKYCELSKSGNVTDIHKLWRSIEPDLKEAINTVYLREVSCQKYDSLYRKYSETSTVCSKKSSSVSGFRMAVELSFHSKFLLIAAYLASYNPPSIDHKLFIKKQSKGSKKRMQKKDQLNCHLLGPKAFGLHRMLAIFYSIVDEGVLPSAFIFSQISSLVSLQLLSSITNEDHLTSPKYKCLAELTLIKNIGRTVNFDVMNYLNDFM